MLKRLRLHGYAGLEYVSPLPQELITGTGTAPRPRLRVDAAQTSFFEGREFRTFKELSIPVAGSYIVRAIVPGDIILHHIGLTLDLGTVRMATNIGGVPTGTFSETLPTFAANTMANKPQPPYTPTVALTAIPTGGSFAGGTDLDIVRAKTAGNSQQASSVGASVSDERGVGAGTYYFILTNLGNEAVSGVFRARWEEYLPGSPSILTY